MRNCVVAQSGGPTTAINASLTGVIRGAMKSENFDKIYGSLHGIDGVLKENFKELQDLTEEDLDLIYKTPSSYLGSCRIKMPNLEDKPEVYEQIFETFKKFNIGAFFYIGGNDSMDTVAKLSKYAEKIHSDIKIAGVPKTIDNDLINTDHTPGFGSAAKYIATSMLEMAHDTAVYKIPCVTIVEIMGRNAGWLTAAAALARNGYNHTPQLIYLPEVDFSPAKFIEDLKKALQKQDDVVVAVSEGIHDEKGIYISAKEAMADKFGHAQLSGVGKTLEGIVKNSLHIKVRSVELNILQRCAAHIASKADLDESQELGEAAVRFVDEGETGFMSGLVRTSNEPYSYEIVKSDIQGIANAERTVPREWINREGNDVTEEMLEYLRPLVQGEVPVSYENGLPVYADISHLS